MKSFYTQNGGIEVGVDEAGRGSLMGPVVSAAVILPQDFKHDLIKDSKKLSNKKRIEAKKIILENAIEWKISFLDNVMVDEMNVLRATMETMHDAIKQLNPKPDHILVDGNQFTPYDGIKHTCVIKGDNEYYSIAAASILAKTFRDEYVTNSLHNEYPLYEWDKNKGYGTKKHIELIKEYGPTKFHRMSFIEKYI